MDYTNKLTYPKQKIAYVLISFIFLIGMFIPTSFNGQLSNIPIAVAQFLNLGAFVTIIYLQKRYKFKYLIAGLIMSIIVWGSTMFNTGIYGLRSLEVNTFILLFILFIIDFKKIKSYKSASSILLVVNIVITVVGLGMIFSNPIINDVFTSFYSGFYDGLVPWMLLLNKPVITFGTHSLAAFYLFAFFFLNLKTYEVESKKLNLVFSLIYLFFCFSLQSNAGYMFFAIGSTLLFIKSKRKPLLIALAILAGVIYVNVAPIHAQSVVDTARQTISNTLTADTNGIIGRYSDSGNQSANLRYIAENPLSPTGLARNFDGLTYFDSGFIANALIGTFVLPIILYGMLFLFFKDNIHNKKTALLLFVAFMIMELGYNNLFYFRTLCIVPFMIIYLNDLETKKVVVKNRKRLRLLPRKKIVW